ncbi:MAG: hypothetical protein EXS08_16845 [Planctomycetes bacterium]|nr:hypothetical protein [Planctomycetota bacterium]
MNASLTSLALAAVPLCLAQPSAAQAGGQFGYTVASADIDGDGFCDVIVGEPFRDGVFSDEGRVLVYPGSAAGLAATPSWTKRGHQRGAHFGSALARAGDVNGDGFDDIVIGAPEFDTPPRTLTSGPGAARYVGVLADQGAIFVFLGSASGLAAAPVLIRTGIERHPLQRARLGRSRRGSGPRARLPRLSDRHRNERRLGARRPLTEARDPRAPGKAFPRR